MRTTTDSALVKKYIAAITALKNHENVAIRMYANELIAEMSDGSVNIHEMLEPIISRPAASLMPVERFLRNQVSKI